LTLTTDRKHENLGFIASEYIKREKNPDFNPFIHFDTVDHAGQLNDGHETPRAYYAFRPERPILFK